jgi:hypothetical protein
MAKESDDLEKLVDEMIRFQKDLMKYRSVLIALLTAQRDLEQAARQAQPDSAEEAPSAQAANPLPPPPPEKTAPLFGSLRWIKNQLRRPSRLN